LKIVLSLGKNRVCKDVLKKRQYKSEKKIMKDIDGERGGKEEKK